MMRQRIGRLALLVSVGALALSAPALAQSNADGERLTQAGRQAFDVGDYVNAGRLLWDASMADEAVRDSIQWQTLRARAVMRTGRPENAVAILDLVGGGTNEDYADALYWRGEALMMMTEEGEAADTFRQALEFDPNHRLANMRLSGLPEHLRTPVAVEAPLIEAAPVERISAEPVRRAQDRTEAPAVTPAPPPAVAPEPVLEAAPPPPAPVAGLQEIGAPVSLRAAPDAPSSPPSVIPVADTAPAGEANADIDQLREIYMAQAATPAQIAAYADAVSGTTSPDIGRDFQIAQLAGMAEHHDLSIALYEAVERAGVETGEISGRNLAVLRANLATELLATDQPQAAMDAANASIEADEEYANAWAVRSLAWDQMGDLGKALEDAKHAFDRGVTAPPVLALLNAAGFAVGVESTQSTLIETPELRGGE